MKTFPQSVLSIFISTAIYSIEEPPELIDSPLTNSNTYMAFIDILDFYDKIFSEYLKSKIGCAIGSVNSHDTFCLIFTTSLD